MSYNASIPAHQLQYVLESKRSRLEGNTRAIEDMTRSLDSQYELLQTVAPSRDHASIASIGATYNQLFKDMERANYFIALHSKEITEIEATMKTPQYTVDLEAYKNSPQYAELLRREAAKAERVAAAEAARIYQAVIDTEKKDATAVWAQVNPAVVDELEKSCTIVDYERTHDGHGAGSVCAHMWVLYPLSCTVRCGRTYTDSWERYIKAYVLMKSTHVQGDWWVMTRVGDELKLEQLAERNMHA